MLFAAALINGLMGLARDREKPLAALMSVVAAVGLVLVLLGQRFSCLVDRIF